MLPFPIMNQYGNIVIRPEIQKFDTGFNHAAILYSTGELYVYGLNTYGQLGDGTTTNNYSTWRLLSSGVIDLWCTQQGTLYRTADKMMYCGDAASISSSLSGTVTSVPIDITSKFSSFDLGTIKIFSAQYGTFVLDGTTLYGIGYNRYSYLGVTGAQNTFVQVLTNVQDVFCGGSTALVRMVDNSVQSVGFNSYGEAGRGNTTAYTTWGVSATAGSIGGTGIRRFVSGYINTIIMTDTALIATGARAYGAMGDGYTSTGDNNRTTFAASTTYSGTFSALKPGRQFGSRYNIIANADGIWVTGYNSGGQLGSTNVTGVIGTWTQLVPPVSMSSIKQVHGCATFTLYLTESGALYGLGTSLLGYSTRQTEFVPITLPK